MKGPMDWNNDGKVDGEDWMLTDMMLDDELGSSGGSSNKPNGSCLASLAFLITITVDWNTAQFINQ